MGALMSDYTVIKERGRGGFGVVEEVVDNDGNLLARKTLAAPPNLDPAHVKARFEREVRYQSAIKHENVVAILKYDLEADPPWFIMPLADCSLADMLKLDRTLGGNPKPVLFDILAGLEEIHRRAFHHRDLKPDNVLKFIEPSGKSRFAVSDFGLMAVGQDGASSLTPSNMGGGTPLYRAPECAINFKRATTRSDIYSFGAILYDIFAPNPKRLPHDELMVPGELGPVVERCTKKNSLRRFKNIEQLRDALFTALNVFKFEFQSGEEEVIIGFLNASDLPNADQWDRVFAFLYDNEDDEKTCRNFFRALTREHIEQLHGEGSDLLGALGKQFADHCRTLSFDFDYCDVLAAKGQAFYDLGDTELKASIATAMLCMGTSHNRWFVERKFMQMVRPEIEEQLAERIAIEVEVLGIDFTKEFDHLMFSINAGEDGLHPVLQARLQR